jgi:hypothetical protein
MRTLSPQAFESPTGKKKIENQVNEKQGTIRLSKKNRKEHRQKVCACGWQNDARRDMLKCGPKDDS